jgi:TetR/AcrR family transcriptional repressor of mexJK operon
LHTANENRARITSKIGPDLRPSSRRKFRAIVEAARQQFLENGFAAASMDQIADTANVSKRTVYKHFEDKQALFAAVVQMLCGVIVTPPMDTFEAGNAEPREVLTKIGIHFLSRIYSKEQIQLFRLIVADAHRFPEVGRMMLDQVTAGERLVYSYMVRQQDRGLLRLPCPEMAASQFLGLLKTDLQMKLLFGQRKRITKSEIERTAECCVDVFLNGVN